MSIEGAKQSLYDLGAKVESLAEKEVAITQQEPVLALPQIYKKIGDLATELVQLLEDAADKTWNYVDSTTSFFNQNSAAGGPECKALAREAASTIKEATLDENFARYASDQIDKMGEPFAVLHQLHKGGIISHTSRVARYRDQTKYIANFAQDMAETLGHHADTIPEELAGRGSEIKIMLETAADNIIS